ncbi:MAG: class I SAM-dependent methyltransferase [Rhodospirillales bacterium]|jgi:hypothetical protein|nr:class I SAM-dependent methyltransferase [Rhodospirillales bacterium]HJO71544.1 class I SAM-dependent methyltransferase [Rhodospirillales bacterium]
MTNGGFPDIFPGLPSIRGQRLVDVGCGEGVQLRLFAGEGAHAVGLDCSAEMIELARAGEQVADETYVEGYAEDVPFEDGEFDVVVFYNSLHHVQVDKQATALAEAARVARSGGLVYLSEPLTRGPHYELIKPVDDESYVRGRAYEAIMKSAQADLEQEDELTYDRIAQYPDYEAFRDRLIRILPDTRAVFAEMDADLRATFERLGNKRADGYEFVQPNRVNLLRRR